MSVALVTGSCGGIGSAILARLKNEGWSVADVDILPEAGFRCDVSSEDEVKACLARVEAELGAVDLLVNNAGLGGPFHTIDEVALDEWERIMAINVRAPFLLCRQLVPRMASRGGGRVVNIASVQGTRGAARSSTYSTSKHALVGLTRSLAVEWGNRGITCNAICPGYVDTAMGLDEEGNPGITARAMARIPAGRQATPDEVASLVAYLASAEAAYMNGAVLPLDGGFSAG